MTRLLRTPDKNAGSANSSCQCASVYGFCTPKKPYRRIAEPTTSSVSGAASDTQNSSTQAASAGQRQRPKRVGRLAYSRPETVVYERPAIERRYTQVNATSQIRKMTAIAVASPTLDGWLLTRS